MNRKLFDMNNEMKDYINAAMFIDRKAKIKLLKEINKAFYVNIPIDNYANIDASINEDGSILFKGDVYKPSNDVSSIDDIYDRFMNLKQCIDPYFDRKNKINDNLLYNIVNIFIILGILIILIFLIYEIFINIMSGNYTYVIFEILFLSSTAIPKVNSFLKSRINTLIIFIKKILHK